MRRFFLGLCLSLSAVSTAFAASVWKVTDGVNTIYLGGTLHILSPNDYPLPDEYEAAYSHADKLVFETDIGALNSPEFARKTVAIMMYNDGKTIEDVLEPDTYSKLTTFLEARGLPVGRIKMMKPSMLGITLSMLEMQRMGLTSEGVDNHFYNRASKENKEIAWFETPEQQLNIISTLGEGEEDAYIQYTLEELRTMKDIMGDMKAYWVSGDMAGLFNTSMKTFKQDYPAVYNDVLTERNNNWLPEIKRYLSDPATEFVLVGTMHMAGEDGLLHQLQQAGFTVSQVN